MSLLTVVKRKGEVVKKVDRNQLLAKLKNGNYLKEVLRKGGVVEVLLDCSGSMDWENKIYQAKKGVVKFVGEAIESGYQVELISFSGSVNLVCDRGNASRIKSQVSEILTGGSTHMAKAIEFATRRLSEDDGQRVILIATDGQPDSTVAALEAAKKAKTAGIDIIAIGTDDADQGFLKKLSSCEKLAEKVDRKDFGRTIAISMKKLKALPAPTS